MYLHNRKRNEDNPAVASFKNIFLEIVLNIKIAQHEFQSVLSFQVYHCHGNAERLVRDYLSLPVAVVLFYLFYVCANWFFFVQRK